MPAWGSNQKLSKRQERNAKLVLFVVAASPITYKLDYCKVLSSKQKVYIAKISTKHIKLKGLG